MARAEPAPAGEPIRDRQLDREVRQRLHLAAQLSLLLARAGPQLEPVLDCATTELAREVGDAAVIALLDPSGEWLDPVSFHHRDPLGEQVLGEVLTGSPTRVGPGLAGDMVRTGRPLRLTDLRGSDLTGRIDPQYAPYAQRFSLRSVLIVPLAAQDRILGTLGLSRAAAYSSADEDLLVDLAGRVALAVEQAQLHAELRRAGEDLAREREELRLQRDRLQSVTDHLPAMVSYWDRDLRNLMANAAYRDFLGQSPAEIAGDESGRPDGRVTTFRIVDEDVRFERELARRATYDDLTGLLKRDAALAQLELTTHADARAPGTGCALLFCDVDGFKGINDQFGHSGGDELLRTVAARLLSCVRGTDIVARLGGDEFLVVLPAVHDVADAVAVAEKIRVMLRARPEPGTVDLRAGITATVSIGVTLAGAGESVDSMISRADSAMYLAKRAGRDRVAVLPPAAEPASTFTA